MKMLPLQMRATLIENIDMLAAACYVADESRLLRAPRYAG